MASVRRNDVVTGLRSAIESHDERRVSLMRDIINDCAFAGIAVSEVDDDVAAALHGCYKSQLFDPANIDPSAALAMPGVHGVLTAADVPSLPDPQETILTNEPLFVGQPILAVAADTEELASDALEQIKVTYEELPFTVDPLQSLYPGGPNARTNGNVANAGIDLAIFKWTAQDFASVAEGQLPTGEAVRSGSADSRAGFVVPAGR